MLETLDELGLTFEDLVDNGQRLHIIHLRNLLNAGLLPDQFRSQLESRLAQIQMKVSPEVASSILGVLRPYQIDGFHFLAYLTENDFRGILAGLVDEDQRHASSAKVDALVELLDPLIAEGNKVPIFSQFVEMLKLIWVRLKEFEMPIVSDHFLAIRALFVSTGC